jgi:hypothetical protein
MTPSTALVVEVRPCPHGMGLFATEDIARGKTIREFRDLALSSKPPTGPEARYALRIGEQEYWEAFPVGSPDYWSNFIDHNDAPNAVFIIDREERRAWLRASMAIGKGQEIFLRYDHYFPSNPRFGPSSGSASASFGGAETRAMTVKA